MSDNNQPKNKKKKKEGKEKISSSDMGQGYALNSERPSTSHRKAPAPTDAYVPPPPRQELSLEARTAAVAALARIEESAKNRLNISRLSIRARARRELDAERRANDTQSTQQSSATKKYSTENLACKGVYFRCERIGPDVLTKQEWREKIKDYLYEQMNANRGPNAAILIRSCNPKEKADNCIQLLTKYLENIIQHPNEEKYCKIRLANNIFNEKVRPVEGAMEFLKAAGFCELKIDDEIILVWLAELVESGLDLPALLRELQSAEAIELELDRNTTVLLPSQPINVALPDDFYCISLVELKREKMLRAQALEEAQVLQTKAMRERAEQRNMKMYRFSLVRIKFPDGKMLQGTFNVNEKLESVFEFVKSCLVDQELQFNIVRPAGSKFNETEVGKNLLELYLVPNVLLLFHVQGMSATATNVKYLRDELVKSVQFM